MRTKTYLIIGGTGGIGKAMVDQLVATTDCEQVNTSVQIFATYHNSVPDIQAINLQWIKMDICDEESIKQGVDKVKQHSQHIDWVINCAGLLHTPDSKPEKALRQIETDFFLKNMQVNALASMLIAKYTKPLLKNAKRSHGHPAIFATISARVGSISDNELGGWYSYRMSKAALNMGMKNLSIEWRRSLKDVCVVVMQPGTVNTQLSAPFQNNVKAEHLFSPAYSAESLLAVLSTMTAEQSGSFVDWAGELIAW